MRAINTNTKSRSISTGKPTEIRIYNSETKVSGHIKYINLHLEDGASESTTTFTQNGKGYTATQSTGTNIYISDANGNEVPTWRIDQQIQDSLIKNHQILEKDAETTLAKMNKTYKKPSQQGSAGITLELKHGNINTYSLLGSEIQIYKEVSKGTWSKLNAAIKEILRESEEVRDTTTCVSEGSHRAVRKAKTFVDEMNQMGAAWYEISKDFVNDLEAKRDELLMDKHETAIKKAEALLNE